MRKGREDTDEGMVRDRILGAAFKAFTENGYAGTTTLDIATRARDLHLWDHYYRLAPTLAEAVLA